tara:strand:+ start:1122 stop:2231 length:1110 start_codon:yes stop_codon:yes gene_type:complete
MDQTENEGNDTALPEEEVSIVEQAKPQTLEEIRQARVEKLTPKLETAEEPKEVAEEEPAEEVSEVEESEETEAGEVTEEVEESEGVLSQIDWDELDDNSRSEIAIQAMEVLPPEKLGELAKKMGSGSGKRIGELTSQIKELKSELEGKSAALSSSLDTVIAPTNALASVTTEDELKNIETETKSNIRFYQNWLAGDEDIFEYKGSDYTRSDIVKYISSLQDRCDDLPKQRKYLKRLEKANDEAKELESKAKEEFTWFGDDESETHQEYRKMIGGEDMAVLKSIAPALAAKLKYQLAHAVTNMVKPKVTRKKKIIIPRKLPKNAVSSSTASNSRQTVESNQVKKLKEAANKGNLMAARQLRQLQINSRYK